MHRELRLILYLILISTFQTLRAQPDTLWTRTYGGDNTEIGFSAGQTADGGFIIVGRTASFGAGSNDAWLIKTDASGDTVWTKTFGGSTGDVFNSVEQTMDGGYIMTGETSSFASYGYSDLWLIKTDAEGDTIWTKTFDRGFSEGGRSVRQTRDGGYVIAGSSGDLRVWLIRTNAFGDTLWTKILGSSLYRSRASSIQITSDGGYLILVNRDDDIWLIRTDSQGTSLWHSYFRWCNPQDFGDCGLISGSELQLTADGGVIITGNRRHNVLLLRADSSGTLIWRKYFNNVHEGQPGSDTGLSVQQANDGGYIIVGMTKLTDNWDVWLLRTNAEGDTLWTRTYGGGGDDQGLSIVKTLDGGYFIVASTTPFGREDLDLWLIKLGQDALIQTEEVHQPPRSFRLDPNYPNPFNPITRLEFDLPNQVDASLKVYDIMGREVATIVNESMVAGYHRVVWDGRNESGQLLPSGIYIARLVTPEYGKSIKMVLMK